MRPWFIKEGDVVPFPKQDTSVPKLPNVVQYPDFLTGVQDLQARVKQGTLSDSMYKKLYTELLHRFMRRESAETPWFMAEAPNTGGIMSIIQQRLKDPNLDPEILQKVLMALEGGGLTKRLQNALQNDPDARKILEKTTETIMNAKGNTEEIDAFIKQYPKGLVNTQALLSPGKKSWAEIFVGYQSDNFIGRAARNLYGLKNQGIGPGEICLSVLSPTIFHSGSKPGAGDVFIEGAGHYEIKGELAKAGRLYDTRKSNVDMNTIETVRKQLKIEKTRVNIKDLIAAKANQQQLIALITSIMRYVKPTSVGGFVKSVLSGNEQQAKIEHTKLAYQNYRTMTAQGKDAFVGIIFMSLNGEWTNTITNMDELVENLAVGTVYLMSPDQADFFPQTTFRF
jgi:hypothetical protein